MVLHIYIGIACRVKLNKDVRVHFSSPTEAFNHYCPHGLPSISEPDPHTCCDGINFDVLLADTFGKLAIADTTDQLCFISRLFQKYAKSRRGMIIPNDFLELSLSVMEHLNVAGRTNVVYNLVKCIGIKRPGEEESRLPLQRMPMGLLEYCVNFFSSSNLQQVILQEYL